MSDSTESTRKKTLAGLNRSDREFLRAYARAKNLTECGLAWAEARGVKYKDRITACSKACRKLGLIKKKIAALGGEENLWEHLGLSLAGVARALSAGMSAEKTIPMMTKDGKILVAGPYPDHATQVAAAMAAAKLRGDLDRKPPAGPEPPAPFTYSYVIPEKEDPGEKP
jgi:hypothetical protein